MKIEANHISYNYKSRRFLLNLFDINILDKVQTKIRHDVNNHIGIYWFLNDLTTIIERKIKEK